MSTDLKIATLLSNDHHTALLAIWITAYLWL